MPDYNVFGLNDPVIEGTGDPDSDSVILYKSVIESMLLTDPRVFEGESPLTGYRNFELLWEHSEFNILVRAAKYDGTAATGNRDAKEIFTKLRGYNGKVVNFKLHRDHTTDDDTFGNYIMTSEDSDIVADFFCLVKPFYYEDTPWDKNYLQLLVQLKSIDPTSVESMAADL